MHIRTAPNNDDQSSRTASGPQIRPSKRDEPAQLSSIQFRPGTGGTIEMGMTNEQSRSRIGHVKFVRKSSRRSRKTYEHSETMHATSDETT
jgi:hypothetical protein